jgi:undecaprenyl-diphosphatase
VSELDAFLLGIVQGLAEFLPVSSKGHLVMGETLLGVRLGSLTFEILVHVATLGAVLVTLWRRIWRVLRERDLGYSAKLALACLPVGAVGFLFKEEIETIFHDPALTGVGLLFTGCVLFGVRFLRPPGLTAPTYVGALVIGLAQVLALLPGVSRSGMTIAAALAMGVAGTAAAEFSFLLSLPVIAAAGALQTSELSLGADGLGAGVLAIGFLSAFAFGILAIRLVYRLLASQRFSAFAFYCWPAGLAFLLYLALR